MVTNICLLLEALSVVFCLHCLYGEKFKLDIDTTSFLAIDMIIMTIINYYGLPKVYTMVIYPIIVLYCGKRFGFKVKEMMINLILCIIIVGGIQMVVAFPARLFFNVQVFFDYGLLLINWLAFLIVLFLLPKCRIIKFTNYLQNKEKIFIITLIMCVALIIFWLISYKGFKVIELNQAILLFVSLVFIFILSGQLSEYKVKAKEIETELKMHKLYADSFQGLIDNIRLRQHEFDNHINTVYSQHFMYNTYGELVNAQKDYCQLIMRENRFNKLLTMGNPVVIGFLYGKFIEIDKMGIDIAYKINISDLKGGIPVYKVVEILGNLIKNAVEALETMENMRHLFVSFIGDDDLFEIEVRNESPYINPNEISSFFTRGFSKKGNDRGFGLYNVKSISDEYMLDVYCENKEIDGRNWLSFRVAKRREQV